MAILNEHATGAGLFQVMAKPTGPLCNLDCTYCFYLEKEKLYPGTKNWAMREDVRRRVYQRTFMQSPDPSPAVPGTNRKVITSVILSAVSCAMLPQ